MEIIIKNYSKSRQVRQTKGWIFEALMLLLDEKPFEKITVSDIVKKAGIARQTFYRNFTEKGEIIREYATGTYDTLSLEKSGGAKNQYQIVLTFNYGYTIKYRKELKKILAIPSIEYLIWREIQEISPALLKPIKASLSKEEYRLCRYKLCYQIIGCRRLFLDWFLDDMPLPVENLVSMLNAMNTPHDTLYRNLPGIVVRVSF